MNVDGADWLYKMTVQKLVVVIKSLDDGEVLERWQFNVECDKSAANNEEGFASDLLIR